MIRYRQKIYSILSDTLTGASIGATLGTIGVGYKKFNPVTKGDNPMGTVGTGLLIGAALGALVGVIRWGDQKYHQGQANQRLFPEVIRMLKAAGFKEGEDFTQDPKKADLLKTKVCVVVSRSNDDLKLLINTVSDPKLKKIAEERLKYLPTSTTVTTKRATDKYNEISISTISTGNGDTGFIAGIVESFIRRGYPVQLIEVG
jgi:hypothetical protein